MARGLLVAVAAAGLAACHSGSGTPTATRVGARDATVQEIIQCFRQHGLPNYPDAEFDPNDGRWHFPNVRPDLPASVRQACASLLPQETAGPAVPNSEFQRLVKFATCMRKHGFPNWPDPGTDGTFALPGTILESSGSKLKQQTQVCSPYLPGGRFPGIRHA